MYLFSFFKERKEKLRIRMASMKRWQRRLAFGCSCDERLLQLKIGLLSNHQNAAANNPSSGAGRITVDAREKENATAMMHYAYRRLQAAASTRASGTRPTLLSINQNPRVCSNFITPEFTRARGGFNQHRKED